jgi:hypothetical protein
MNDLDTRPHQDDALWSEALWGVGLLGTVIAIVALIATFGP